jgi:hypothetical protein
VGESVFSMILRQSSPSRPDCNKKSTKASKGWPGFAEP